MFTFHFRHVFPCAVLLLISVPGCTPANELSSDDGEDGPAPVSITVFTDKVELFMEYPRLVPGLQARFLAHVTVLSTGEPVRSGNLTLEFVHAGSGLRLEATTPTRDGLFIPEGSFESPGTYQASIIVESVQVEETIPLDPIVVYPDMESAQAAADAEATEDPPDTVPFLLEQQWKIGLLLEQITRRSLIHRLQVPGEVEAPHGASAIVSGPVAGRLTPPNSGKLPHIGDHVEAGQVLAFLEPPLTTSDLAQLTANETFIETLDMDLLVREFDLQAKALEVDRALLQSSARLEFARQAVNRLQGLREKGLGTEAELEAAERDLRVAQHQVEGEKALKESYANATTRLRDLRMRASFQDGQQLESAHSLRLPLVAPISGEIVQANHIEGEHIEAQAAVYRVVDSRRVSIVAQVSEFDLSAIDGTPGALVELAAYPSRRFDILGSLGGQLINIGQVLDPETRTILIRYEVPNPDGVFRIGMFADVHIETAASVGAVAIPEEAIVMDNGRPIAFVLLSGETFQKRDLVLGIRDGRYVEVKQGIAEGERVATKGAYLVKLASASPASFGEGHAH